MSKDGYRTGAVFEIAGRSASDEGDGAIVLDGLDAKEIAALNLTTESIDSGILAGPIPLPDAPQGTTESA